jgi:hypothetical protein
VSESKTKHLVCPKDAWSKQEAREATKRKESPPKIDPLKGASYHSNRKETHKLGREQKLMKAVEKAQQLNSRDTSKDKGPTDLARTANTTTSTNRGGGEADGRKKTSKSKTKAFTGNNIGAPPGIPPRTVKDGTLKLPKVSKQFPAKRVMEPAVPHMEKRAGSNSVPKATDTLFCKHYGIRDLVSASCCALGKAQNEHYAVGGNFLEGVSCKQCTTPAKGLKKVKESTDGVVAYWCEMGAKAFVVEESERDNAYYTERECSGCYICFKCARVLLSKLEEEDDKGGRRSSRRRQTA